MVVLLTTIIDGEGLFNVFTHHVLFHFFLLQCLLFDFWDFYHINIKTNLKETMAYVDV